MWTSCCVRRSFPRGAVSPQAPAGSTNYYRIRQAILLAIGAVAIGAVAIDSAANELVLADGRRMVGEFVGFVNEGRLGFVANLEPVELRPEEVILWGRLPEITSPIIVVLADGSLLGATNLSLGDEEVRLRGLSFLETSLPVELLAGIILSPPTRRERRDRLVDEILWAAGKDDELLLANGDRIAGLVLRLDDKTCLVEISGATASVPRDNIVAITFQPQLRATLPPPKGPAAAGNHTLTPRMLVGLLDGSLLLCDGGRTLRPANELRLSFGPALAVKSGVIVFLQTLGGWGVYLSDLEPVDYEHRPFLSIARPLGRDRSAVGSRLRKGGRVYPKGLGMQSWSRVKYRLEGKFRRFEALVGLDDLAGDRGSVEFVVRVDGKDAYRSGPVRGSDPLQPVVVDVSGAEELELVVEFAERAHEFDFANWFLARVLY